MPQNGFRTGSCEDKRRKDRKQRGKVLEKQHIKAVEKQQIFACILWGKADSETSQSRKKESDFVEEAQIRRTDPGQDHKIEKKVYEATQRYRAYHEKI